MGKPKWKNFTKEEIQKILEKSNSYSDFWLKLGYKWADNISTVQKCLDYYNLKPNFEEKKNEQFKREYIGKIYNHLTILGKDEEKSKEKKATYVFVQCDCKNRTVFSVRLNALKTGSTTSCGCVYKNFWHEQGIKNREDLTGYQTNKLTVLSYNPVESKKHNRPYWNVHCECGREYAISAISIKKGQLSCGCQKSKGELFVAKTLELMNIFFIKEYSFENLVGEEKPLRFDFYLPKENICIECQGEQHYKPVIIFGGQERFDLQQNYDNKKRQYCKENNIKLIEIPYWDYDKIDEEYLLKLISI